MWLVTIGLIYQTFTHRDALDAYAKALEAEHIKYQVTYIEDIS